MLAVKAGFDELGQNISKLESSNQKRHDSLIEILIDLHRKTLKDQQSLKEGLAESSELYNAGEYQESAEKAELVARKFEGSDKAEAHFNAASHWCVAIVRKRLKPGMSPEAGLSQFRKNKKLAVESGLSEEKSKHLALRESQLETMFGESLESVLVAANAAIENTEDSFLLLEARQAKAETHGFLGQHEEAVSELAAILASDLLSKNASTEIRIQTSRICVLAKAATAKQEDVDSFIEFALTCEENAAEANEMINMVSSVFVRRANELNNGSGIDYKDGDASLVMKWATQILESGYELMLKTNVDSKSLAEHAFRISERTAVLGDVDMALKYLSLAERWINTLKDNLTDESEFSWAFVRSWALANRGRTFWRLCRNSEELPNRTKMIYAAMDAFKQARHTATENESQFKGNIDQFSCEMDYWIGECHSAKNEHTDAIKLLEDAQSPVAMADDAFAKTIGYMARFREAEERFIDGQDDKAIEMFKELEGDPRIPENVRALTISKLHKIDSGPVGLFIDSKGKLRFGVR